MKNPLQLAKKYLIGKPLKFYRDYLSLEARHNKIFQPIANFVFDRSKDLPVIMLCCNAVSIAASHIAQIGGLRRSNRENKNYLITQEVCESVLDLFLTIIPPFILNNHLAYKLDSGEWVTKSARDKYRYIVASTVGVNQDELYQATKPEKVGKIISNTANSLLNGLKSSKKIPANLRNKIKATPISTNQNIPMVKMDQITTDFDTIRKRKYKGFYNGSAYDEIMGQRNGILMMAAIGFTILASNVIIPILRNKLANKIYDIQLKKTGETQESLKRKKRYNALTTTIEINNKNNIFNTFSNADNTTTTKPVVDRHIYSNLLTTKNNSSKVFNNIQKYGVQAFKAAKLRI
ncbi:MAG: hypothetical protein E7Z90_06025 [Cyanobacteria bacterium SIG29]|nr:hypothetical protein [Cyanobacteria bacterium SIG29]